jgi:hypothetical protein
VGFILNEICFLFYFFAGSEFRSENGIPISVEKIGEYCASQSHYMSEVTFESSLSIGIGAH